MRWVNTVSEGWGEGIVVLMMDCWGLSDRLVTVGN